MAFDLAVFGSGFAAHEITRLATQAGRSVIVLEKGAAKVEPAAVAMSVVPFRREPVVSGGFDFGAQVQEAFGSLPRYIGLGGTSELWSGKWRRLDNIDLTRTIGRRRWPIASDVLTKHYDQVAADYGWPDWSDDVRFAQYRDLVAAHGLRLIDILEETPPLRLRERWSALAGTGVEIVCGVTVRSSSFDPTGRELRTVTIESEGGSRIIEAARFVVACGGIESVHMSHALREASRGQSSAELPVRYGGYVDHPKAFVGELLVERHHETVDYLAGVRGDAHRLLAFGLPEDDLARRELGNHTVFLWPGDRPGDAMQLVINLEQFPEPGNFIAVWPPTVSWRLTERTWRDYQTFMDQFVPRLRALFGNINIIESPTFRGASHPACCLPMSDSPDHGELDINGRFHDKDNLFCVSSAAFPLAGSANPTMTVVALARRFGEFVCAGAPA